MIGSTGDREPPDAARTAPAASRNREPILGVLRAHLPPASLVLEIASGTGEHGAWFSEALPGVTWQPTDRDPDALASIAARQVQAGSPNLLPPLPLDASLPEGWPVRHADAVVAINMIHIAPWAATMGLMQGAGCILPQDGVLYLYGPFLEAGVATASGNAAFDSSLRARESAWGLRELDDVRAVAATHGLQLVLRQPMPANNLSLLFRKTGASPG